MSVLRCDSCGGETFEPLAEPGYFRCHNCGAAGTVKLAQPASGVGGPGLWLIGSGPKKIQVIKVVREATNWGLKEAKDAVDACDRSPQLIPVLEGFPGGSDRIAAELTSAGAQIRRS